VRGPRNRSIVVHVIHLQRTAGIETPQHGQQLGDGHPHRHTLSRRVRRERKVEHDSRTRSTVGVRPLPWCDTRQEDRVVAGNLTDADAIARRGKAADRVPKLVVAWCGNDAEQLSSRDTVFIAG
jgi:hypothetical protein